MISLLLISPAPYMSRYVQHLAADSVVDEELHPAVAEDHPRHAKEPGTGCPIIPAQSFQISKKNHKCNMITHTDSMHALLSLYTFSFTYSLKYIL